MWFNKKYLVMKQTINIVFNKIIPFKGFKAITIWPWIFVRIESMSRWLKQDEWHETTHLWQQVETMVAALAILLVLAVLDVVSWWWLLSVPFSFYVLYLLEWLIRIPICCFDTRLAYYNISTEQEAYLHQDIATYNSERRKFAWARYLFRNSFMRDPVTEKIVKKE